MGYTIFFDIVKYFLESVWFLHRQRIGLWCNQKQTFMEELRQVPMPEPMMNDGSISEIPSEKIKEPLSKEIQNLQALKRYDVRLKFLDHGMVIEVGCKAFAFCSVEEGMANLQAYAENPVHVQKTWLEKVGY